MKAAAYLAIPVILAALGALAYLPESKTQIMRVAKEINPKALIPGGEATLLFTGDLMLDRGVASHARLHGDDALFDGVKALMLDADAVVVNLETTLTDFPSVAVPGSTDLRFTSDPRFASLLASLKVRAASLSNNHTDDFGDEGLRATRAYLKDAGIAYFGSPANRSGEVDARMRINGKSVCFAGYEGFIAIDPGPVATKISELRPACDFIFATMHAGEEYERGPTKLQQDAARAFIDAGADAVIGTHPHIAEPLEFYRGKPIFYSLGNFIFDQDFSWGTTHALLLRVTLGRSGQADYELIPIEVRRAEAAALGMDSPDASRIIDMLTDESWTDELRARIVDKKSFSIDARGIVGE